VPLTACGGQIAGASVVDAAIDASAGEGDAGSEPGPEAGSVEAGPSGLPPIGVYDHCAYSAIEELVGEVRSRT
jgi:hypothetical protein